MPELPLENSSVRAVVDEADYERVLRFKWYLNKGTGYVYGYIPGNQKVYLHRFVLGLSDPSVVVDHADDNPLNCCRSNLTPCTNKQNTERKRKLQGMTSRFKGVCWGKRESKWRANIVHNGKQVYLGNFENEEDAARAYDRKASELFGKFARLNFTEATSCQH